MKRVSIAVVTLVSTGCAAVGLVGGCIAEMNFYTPTSGTGGAGGGGCEPGTVAPCYAGPEETEGVGLCKAGEQTCNDDGMTYGPCVGELQPMIEDCATPIDDDCDGLAPACMGTPLWSKRFGDSAFQAGASVAADKAGNVLLAGSFFGTVDFGNGPLVSAGESDIRVAKFSP